MVKKTGKQLIFSVALLIFSLLLISGKPMTAFAEEIEENQAENPWSENLPIQAETYYEEYKQESQPPVNLSAGILAENEVLEDAYSPGIEIQRTWLESRSFLTVYQVTSEKPAWVVFHADKDGLPGAILHKIYVGSGSNSIAKIEDVREFSSDQIHVMLHYDFGMSSLFEFPGPDGPVYVENEVINETCYCPF